MVSGQWTDPEQRDTGIDFDAPASRYYSFQCRLCVGGSYGYAGWFLGSKIRRRYRARSQTGQFVRHDISALRRWKVAAALSHDDGIMGGNRGVTALWQVGNLVYAKRQLGQAKSLHTTLNRLTGLLLFMLPLIWAYGCFEPAAGVAAGLALLSAGEESLQLKKMAHSKA